MRRRCEPLLRFSLLPPLQSLIPYLNHFVQADNIELKAGNIEGLDRFAYVSDNPVKRKDPTGRASCVGKNYDDGPNCLKNRSSELSIEVANTEYQKACAAGLTSACPGGALGGLAFLVSAIVNPLGLAIVTAASALGLHPANPMAIMTAGAGGNTYIRYMSEGELAAVHDTGLLRGGSSGKTFFTTEDNLFDTVGGATSKLSLPTPPQVGVQFSIKNLPKIIGPEPVDPAYERLGTGEQLYSEEPVEVEIYDTWDLMP